MNATDKFKTMVIDGDIKIPETKGELISLLERFGFMSKCDDDIECKIDELKSLFISNLSSKSGSNDWCYISRIKDGILKGKNKNFSDIFKALYGCDAISHVISLLIVEKLIRVSGKKVYLIGDHNER